MDFILGSGSKREMVVGVKKIDLFLKVELSGLAGSPFTEDVYTARRVFFTILVIKQRL